MASKKTKAPAEDDNLDELFSGIGDDAKTRKPTAAKTAKSSSSAKAKAGADKDILADLESELQDPSSRPHTPRAKEATAKRSTATPPLGESLARKSTDSARSLRVSFTPSATSSELQESERRGTVEQVQSQEQTGGWWGGFSSLATGVMKQAESAYKELQQNEEAKKWAEQVKGLRENLNVNTLQSYGDELRHRALPTFTNLLHTLAPPISSHERLLIHITHDLVGYPSLDPLVHGVFARAMSQVEGGDLLVVQRGQESSSRRSDGAGWQDGPWWRQVGTPRDLGIVKGLPEATKLCRASADGYAQEYFAAHGGLEAAKLKATEAASETNPVRTSDVFLSVQAIGIDADKTLFALTAASEKEKESSTVKEPQAADGGSDETVAFAVFLLDPVHQIEFSTVSQAIPSQWVRWLDAPTPLTPGSGDDGHEDADFTGVPDDIQEIIDSGGVDPREWVAEWIEETLNLSVGIIAQKYVARRMGVGEGGIGRGKQRADDLVTENPGEAARVGLI